MKTITHADFKALIQIVSAFSLQSAAGCVIIKIVFCDAFSGGSAGRAAREKPDSGRVELLELEQAKKRVEELRAVIEKNNRLYYDQDAPELEDFEYDALIPGTERIGSTVSAAGHGIIAYPEGRRHGQQQAAKGDPCGKNGKPAGCIFV